MHLTEQSLPPSVLLFRYAPVLMAPNRALGRLLGLRLSPVSLVAGLLTGTYAYLWKTGRVSIHHGQPAFPPSLPFALHLSSSRLLIRSAGPLLPESWSMERLLYRSVGSTTAEASARALALLVGYQANSDGSGRWQARYLDMVAHLCRLPPGAPVPGDALEQLEQGVLLPFLAEDPARTHDLAAESIEIVTWLHTAQYGEDAELLAAWGRASTW